MTYIYLFLTIKALYMEVSDKIYTDELGIKIELTLICVGGAIAFSGCSTNVLVLASVVRLITGCREIKQIRYSNGK